MTDFLHFLLAFQQVRGSRGEAVTVLGATDRRDVHRCRLYSLLINRKEGDVSADTATTESTPGWHYPLARSGGAKSSEALPRRTSNNNANENDHDQHERATTTTTTTTTTFFIIMTRPPF
jgi:hypothetical protein